MRRPGRVVAAGLIATAGGAAAQSDTPRLALHLNGQSSDGSIAITFAARGCEGTLEMTQTYENGARRSAITEFGFADLTADGVEIGYAEQIDLTMLNLALRGDAPPVPTAIALAGADAQSQVAWQDQGANCRSELCTITIEQPFVQFVVAGPNSDTRAEFVLQDLRTLTSSCAASSGGQ